MKTNLIQNKTQISSFYLASFYLAIFYQKQIKEELTSNSVNFTATKSSLGLFYFIVDQSGS